MCHLAELSVERLLTRPAQSWGFNFGKYWEVLGRSGYESTTDQSVRREMRVWAYQWNLHQELKLPIDQDQENQSLRDLVSSVVYMDAFFIYRNKVLTKSQRTELGYNQADNKAIDIMVEEIQDLAKSFTYERFVDEWNLRMNALKD